MTCEESQRLIPLFRPGERTPAESSSLESHLQVCAACRRASEELATALEHAVHLVAGEPVLPEPEAFTRSVMAAIAVNERQAGSSLLDRALAPGRHPAFQFALLGVIAATLLTLGVQTFDTLAGARQIERRFAAQASGSARASVEYDVDLSQVHVPATQEQRLRSAGLLPDEDSRLTVTRGMVKMVEALFDNPVMPHDAAHLSAEYRSIFTIVQQSARVRFTVSHDD